MRTAAECLTQAVELSRLARLVTAEPPRAAALFEMAQQWRTLATHAAWQDAFKL